jgi:uracil-DNA glycosylase
MALLRDALNDFAVDWRNDLTAAWRTALAGASPDPLSIDSTLTYDELQPIYPSRRDKPLPGARADAHVFRAFDGLAPSKVRCVLIGQDPYPALRRATGRSFEQGDIDAWNLPAASVANSLRVLLRMLVAARTNDSAVVKMSWTTFLRHIATPGVALESPRALFDRLQQTQGVLFLNAGLTITRYQSGGGPEQTRGHIPFWRPVVGQVLRSMAVRRSGQVVFLCLGALAQKLLVNEGVMPAATQAGTWETRAGEVALPHPVAPGFINGPNPFKAVNAKLLSFGGAPIDW